MVAHNTSLADVEARAERLENDQELLIKEVTDLAVAQDAMVDAEFYAEKDYRKILLGDLSLCTLLEQRGVQHFRSVL